MSLAGDRPNYPDSGSDTGRSKNPRTWSFHERYASDPEFKRQIDEGRKRSQAKHELAALKDALSMVQNRKRIY